MVGQDVCSGRPCALTGEVPVLFCLQAAMSSRVTCRVLAMDLRGHGEVTHWALKTSPNVCPVCYGQGDSALVIIHMLRLYG